MNTNIQVLVLVAHPGRECHAGKYARGVLVRVSAIVSSVYGAGFLHRTVRTLGLTKRRRDIACLGEMDTTSVVWLRLQSHTVCVLNTSALVRVSGQRRRAASGRCEGRRMRVRAIQHPAHFVYQLRNGWPFSCSRLGKQIFQRTRRDLTNLRREISSNILYLDGKRRQTNCATPKIPCAQHNG
jgi:hypothetical protein